MMVLVLASLLAVANAGAELSVWKGLPKCEPPAIFFSSNHVPGKGLCCNVTRPSIGICPGGTSCPPDGRCLIPCSPGSFCPKGNACPANGQCELECVPATDALNALPNIVLVVTDDQAYCGFGFAGTCRSDSLGTPVPVPYTPVLDNLAARGKVFPVAHNSGNWCFPSLDTIVTGRMPPHKNCMQAGCAPPGARMEGEVVGSAGAPTIAQLLTAAGPGYCTYQVGKGNPAGYDANRGGRNIGKAPCARCGAFSWFDPLTDGATCQFDPALCPDPLDENNPACDTAPKCGEDISDLLGTTRVKGTGEVDIFLADLVATGLDGKRYQPKKFFLWYGLRLPHRPTAPPDVVEHRPHLSEPIGPSHCKDFLFGHLCTESSPGNLQVGGPRFPFGDPMYADTFRSTERRSLMQGLYGNIWWMDSAIGRIRKFLAKPEYEVEGPTGPASMAANTVFIVLSDNGAFLPRSKKKFAENGYRTPLIIYDPRNETPPGESSQIEDDIAHGKDILPTVLSYAGVTSPPEVLGKDLRLRAENPGGPSLREAVCGTDIRGSNGNGARYILPRIGRIGQCTTLTGTQCVDDGGCNAGAGELCTSGGVCAVATARACIDDDDCHINPGDTQVCEFQDRKWCNTTPLKTCSADSDCRTAACRTCTLAPSKTCVTDQDCGSNARWGVCQDAPGGKLACQCGHRTLKLYHSENGLEQKITDLLTDSDETGLIDGTALADATNPAKLNKVANRLRCCLDDWWLPPTIAPASCPLGCDGRVDCSD